jgi:hypothetical protein
MQVGSWTPQRPTVPIPSELSMLLNQAIFHSNRYHAETACEHCFGVIRHKSWSITRNPLVYYAYEAVLDPEKLTFEDQLMLYAPGCPLGGQGLFGSLRHRLTRELPRDFSGTSFPDAAATSR